MRSAEHHKAPQMKRVLQKKARTSSAQGLEDPKCQWQSLEWGWQRPQGAWDLGNEQPAKHPWVPRAEIRFSPSHVDLSTPLGKTQWKEANFVSVRRGAGGSNTCLSVNKSHLYLAPSWQTVRVPSDALGERALWWTQGPFPSNAPPAALRAPALAKRQGWWSWAWCLCLIQTTEGLWRFTDARAQPHARN